MQKCRLARAAFSRKRYLLAIAKREFLDVDNAVPFAVRRRKRFLQSRYLQERFL